MNRQEVHFRTFYRDKYDKPKGWIVRFFAGKPISRALIKRRTVDEETYEVWIWDDVNQKVTLIKTNLSSEEAFHELKLFTKLDTEKLLVFHWKETEEFEYYVSTSLKGIMNKAEEVFYRLVNEGRISAAWPQTEDDIFAVFYECLTDYLYFNDYMEDCVQLGEHFECWIEE